MSYRKIEKAAWTRAAVTGVKMAMVKREDGPAQLLVTPGPEVLAGFVTDAPLGARWRVLLGEAEDAGSLRILLDSDGEFRLSASRHGHARLYLGEVKGLATQRLAGCWCRWTRISDLCIEVCIPRAFLASDKAVAVPVPPAAPRAPRRGLGSY